MAARLFHAFAAFFLSLAVLTACNAADEPMRLPVDGSKLVVMDGDRTVAQFDVEIASLENERAAGLMFRTDLPADRGMLFVFDGSSERYFWMKNTPAPLDIIFADANGEIVSVAADTVSFSETPIPSYKPAKYAFEVLAGTAKRLEIKPGQRLVHPVIGNSGNQ